MSITAEEKAKVISDFATNKGDTGSPEVQIAILTSRINIYKLIIQLMQTLKSGIFPYHFVGLFYFRHPLLNIL